MFSFIKRRSVSQVLLINMEECICKEFNVTFRKCIGIMRLRILQFLMTAKLIFYNK